MCSIFYLSLTVCGGFVFFTLQNFDSLYGPQMYQSFHSLPLDLGS